VSYALALGARRPAPRAPGALWCGPGGSLFVGHSTDPLHMLVPAWAIARARNAAARRRDAAGAVARRCGRGAPRVRGSSQLRYARRPPDDGLGRLSSVDDPLAGTVAARVRRRARGPARERPAVGRAR